MDQKLERLLIWIARNNEAEPGSGFLPWGPAWHVATRDLIDAVVEIFGVTKAEAGAVINAENERRAGPPDDVEDS